MSKIVKAINDDTAGWRLRACKKWLWILKKTPMLKDIPEPIIEIGS